MSEQSDKLRAQAIELWNVEWNERTGQVVPSTDSVAHSNGAVKVEATYLYADLADSTEMQKLFDSDFAARVHRMYLGAASDIIREANGSIKSFDGDRVMGIFMGNSMRTQAAGAALKINWAVEKILNELAKTRKRPDGNWWTVKHGVGIDTGDALIVRAGVRNKAGTTSHNDLISIGAAPAVAAKLSGERNAGASILITSNVYSRLNESVKLSAPDKKPMFTGPKQMTVGPYSVNVYTSDWMRTP
ncbi:hypothetical protein [Pseudarthrobacter sp. WHRI 8279]|uniref:adenylate/guanylate cyclase domain-containing protein n=1 Tax=Pseudarthrobacter sp. WHRI 8279 TaxID=3162566 RepID=UPI0032ED492D